MTRRRLMWGGGVLLTLAAMLAWVLLRGAPGEASADPETTASVTLAAIRRVELPEVVSAYGVVQADALGAQIIASPKAAIVSRVLVRAGESVAAGQPLLELANAPGAQLAFSQAETAARFAQADLARVQRLHEAQLAANDQLLAAQKALADAQAALAAQQIQGAGRALQVMVAAKAGVVTSLSVAAGDHVAQDAPLLVLARLDGTVVKLGLEPGGQVAVGQKAMIYPVFGAPPIASQITMVGRAMDPINKTVDAIVPLNGAKLPIGGAVRGEVTIATHSGFLAPRAAVVFDETGPHIFVVSLGKARRVFVGVGPDQGDDIEVKGQVAPGDLVAVEGAYELQDGMTVKVRGK